MGTEYWDEIQELFADAAELGPSERAALLAARCAGRPQVRAEVESLLASYSNAEPFLRVPTLADCDRDRSLTEDFAGRTVGRFRLLEKIGEGGIGIVHRAERADGEFSEHVAIKLIDLPIHNPDALRRFRIERQILASLNHPDIVTLLDGGFAAPGQAYLAMKYVDGVPITEYCADRRIGLEGRLRVFQRVCAAVQYAHQNGVVHRDLKPSNILVALDAIPKILDFGVAKLLDPSGTESEATRTSLLQPMTPNYASPEQLRGLAVTTASDIYALGVLLYELLSGVRPYETTGKPLDEVLAAVVNGQPVRPSAATAPGRELPYERRSLRGDLDAIVLKAMSKEPERRYASARELAEDLTRHLERQPVLARESSFAYSVATLARRHRPAFVAAGISAIALVSALVISVRQTRIAVGERNRAAARFNDARQLANALIFKIHDDVRPLAGSTPVRQIIVAEALTYLERLSADTTADAALRIELAKGYHRVGEIQGRPSIANLGDRRGALDSLRRAVALLRPLVADGRLAREAALELGRVQITLADVAAVSGARDEAAAARQDAVTIAEALVKRDSRDSDAKRLLGSAYFAIAGGAPPDSRVGHWERTLEVFEALLREQPDDPDRQRNVALVHKYLGGHFQGVQNWERALSHHQSALKLDEQRVTRAPSHRPAQLDLAIDLGNVAFIHRVAGRLHEAAAGYERSLELRRRLSESDPQDEYARGRVAYVLGRLALISADLGRNADAVHYAQEAVKIAETRSKVDSPSRMELIDYLDILANVETRAGLRQSACGQARQAAALARDVDLKGYASRPGLADSIAQMLLTCQ